MYPTHPLNKKKEKEQLGLEMILFKTTKMMMLSLAIGRTKFEKITNMKDILK